MLTDIAVRTTYLAALLLVVSFLGAPLTTAAQSTATVSVTWDPVPDLDVAGYRVYYGGKTRTYTNTVEVTKPNIVAIISGLTFDAPYFFAVTAFNQLGLESDYSVEVAYTPPAPASELAVIPNGPLKARLRFTIAGTLPKTFRVYTNAVAAFTATATASPVTVDLPVLASGLVYTAQVGLLDTTGVEQSRSAPITFKFPGVVVNPRRN